MKKTMKCNLQAISQSVKLHFIYTESPDSDPIKSSSSQVFKEFFKSLFTLPPTPPLENAEIPNVIISVKGFILVKE